MTQDPIIQVMDMIEKLSDDMLAMAVTLIEVEQRKRETEAKELKDDEMRYDAEMEDRSANNEVESPNE